MIFDLSKSYSINDIGKQCQLCRNPYRAHSPWFDCKMCNYHLVILYESDNTLVITFGDGFFPFPRMPDKYILRANGFGLHLYKGYEFINKLNSSPIVDLKEMKNIAERYTLLA